MFQPFFSYDINAFIIKYFNRSVIDDFLHSIPSN